MPKIRRKSIENDFLLIFFCMQSEGVAQSSILMILRHPLLFLYKIPELLHQLGTLSDLRLLKNIVDMGFHRA